MFGWLRGKQDEARTFVQPTVELTVEPVHECVCPSLVRHLQLESGAAVDSNNSWDRRQAEATCREVLAKLPALTHSVARSTEAARRQDNRSVEVYCCHSLEYGGELTLSMLVETLKKAGFPRVERGHRVRDLDRERRDRGGLIAPLLGKMDEYFVVVGW